MIEEWDAHLEGVGHAELIGIAKQGVAHVGSHLCQAHLAQKWQPKRLLSWREFSDEPIEHRIGQRHLWSKHPPHICAQKHLSRQGVRVRHIEVMPAQNLSLLSGRHAGTHRHQHPAQHSPTALGPRPQPIQLGQARAALKHGVASKQLVAPQAAQRDFHPCPSRRSAHHVRVQSVCTWMVHGPEAVRHLSEEIARRQADLVMVRSKSFRHKP